MDDHTQHPQLFPTAKRQRKATKAPDPFAGETQKLVALYVRLYTGKIGEPPRLDKLDGVRLRRLVVLCASPAKVAERLTFFMAQEDDYIRTHGGYTLRNFEFRWNDIVNLMQKSAPRVPACPHHPPCPTAAAHTRRMIDDHRAQMIAPLPPSPSKPSDVF